MTMKSRDYRKNQDDLDRHIFENAKGLDWIAMLLYGFVLMLVGLSFADSSILHFAFVFNCLYLTFLVLMLFIRIRQKADKIIIWSYTFACLVMILMVAYFAWSVNNKMQEQETPEHQIMFDETKKVFMNYDNGDTLQTKFTYYNDTDLTLTIDSVRTSCGCTDVRYEKDTQPGCTSEIVASVDLQEEFGMFSHTIVVYFHHNHPVILKIIGKIK